MFPKPEILCGIGICAGMLLAGAQACGDVIRLKDGREVRGRILKDVPQPDRFVTIETIGGTRESFSEESIVYTVSQPLASRSCSRLASFTGWALPSGLAICMTSR